MNACVACGLPAEGERCPRCADEREMFAAAHEAATAAWHQHRPHPTLDPRFFHRKDSK